MEPESPVDDASIEVQAPFDSARLSAEITRAIQAIREGLDSGAYETEGNLLSQSQTYRSKLAILQALVEMPEPVLEPDLCALAPRGHSFQAIEDALSLAPGKGLEMLEDLADLGLLQRELFNRIHLCPHCDVCHLNFRESCPVCGAIDVEIERMIHHFHCGYVGLESEFSKGIELVCTKCRQRLDQLGQDFERPHETYVCRAEGHLFEEPLVQVQCLRCRNLFSGGEIDPVSVYRYRPTELTMRAVELRRLTGLDVAQILYNQSLGLATREFLALEMQREMLRIKRYGGSFATAILSFDLHGKPYQMLREWPATMIRELGRILMASVRALDLVAIMDHTRIGLMLYETEEEGSSVVARRILAELESSVPSTPTGQPLSIRWRDATWDAVSELADVVAFFDGEEER